jgi:hypothetical protein
MIDTQKVYRNMNIELYGVKYTIPPLDLLDVGWHKLTKLKTNKERPCQMMVKIVKEKKSFSQPIFHLGSSVAII